MAAIMMAWLPTVAAACHLTTIPIDGGTGRSDHVSVALGTADDARHPTAWQGPLRIATEGGSACLVSDEVAIVEGPVMLGGTLLYVPTYSGGNNRLYAVDTKSCRVLWRSQAFTGSTSFRGGHLVIGRRRVALDPSCRPAGVAKGLPRE